MLNYLFQSFDLLLKIRWNGINKSNSSDVFNFPQPQHQTILIIVILEYFPFGLSIDRIRLLPLIGGIKFRCRLKRISSQPDWPAFLCNTLPPRHHHSFMVNVMRKNTLIFPLIVWISAHFPSLCSDSIEREKLCSWCRWTWMAVVAGGEGGFSSVLSATGWLLQFVGILQLAAGIATGLATTDWASERLIKRLTQGISQFYNPRTTCFRVHLPDFQSRHTPLAVRPSSTCSTCIHTRSELNAICKTDLLP